MTGAKEVPKLLGGMAVIIAMIVVLLIAGAALLWHVARNDIHLNGADQSIGVRSAAESWSTRAVRHFGADVSSRIQCTIPRAAANPNANYFPVTCQATTTSGGQVRLRSAHAGIQAFNDGNTEYLSGPWTFQIGGRTRQLPCLPSTWQTSPPCPATQ